MRFHLFDIRASKPTFAKRSFPSMATFCAAIIIPFIGAVAQAQTPVANEPSLQAAQSTSTLLKLDWVDNGLMYDGYISSDLSLMKIDGAMDRYTKQYVDATEFKASSERIPNGYAVRGVIAVPGDSVNLYPHEHEFNLILQNDGGFLMAENRVDGIAYPASISE